MKLIVGINDIRIDEKDKLNAGEYNIHEVEFEFDEAYNDLIKKAVFSGNGHCYLVEIANNKCTIPYEVLSETGDVSIGAFGYAVDGDNLVLRYSPAPVYVYINLGSYKDSYDNYHQPTADIVEQLTKQIEDAVAEVEEYDGRITQNANDIDTLEQTKANISDLSDVATSGSYNDLSNKPDLSHFITKDVNNLTYYELKTATGNNIVMSINSSTYVLTISLRNSANQVLNTQTVDLPLETMVVGGSYDSTNKKIILTLKNGNTIDIPVADLISGLQTEITPSNKLSADLVNDSLSTNKFVTASDKTNWNGKYSKPSGGIPKTDLASAVQTSLGKADTAIQDISGKVDKVQGKGLSTNDYTNADKEKLDDLDNKIDGNAKTTETGTVVTLNDTLNSSLSIGLEATSISQDGTPTPTSPQDVHTISGNNTIVVSDGGNLFNKDKPKDNYYYNNNGEEVIGSTYAFINISYKPTQDKITISFTSKTGNSYVRLCEYNSSGGFIKRTLIDTNSTTTLNSNTTSVIFCVDSSSVDYFTDLQIEEGSTATPYKEFNGTNYNVNLGDIEYCKIGNYEDKFIKTSGKNLLYINNNTVTNNGITGTFTNNNILTYSGTATNSWADISDTTTYTLPQGNYTFSIDKATTNNERIVLYLKQGSEQTIIIYGGQTRYTFESNGTNTTYRIGISGLTNGNSYSGTVKLQLEKGSIATEYEPYGTDEWYIKKNIKKIVLGDSESWYLARSTTPYVFSTTIDDYLRIDENTSRCTHFQSVVNGTYGSMVDGETKFRYYNDSTNNLYMCSTVASTATDFKNWLANNNVTIYYILATPTYTKIEGTLATQIEALRNALSKEKQTNISQINNDLPFNLEATAYVRTINGMYDSLKEEKADKSDMPSKTSDLQNDSNFTAQEVYITEITSSSDPNAIFVFENKKRGIYFFNATYDVNQFRYKKTEDDVNYSSETTHPVYLQIYKDVDFDNIQEDEVFAILIGEKSSGNISKYKIKKVNNNISIASAVGLLAGSLVTTKAQDIAGVKTFYSIPKQNDTTAPTQDAEFTNKKYVDDTAGLQVAKSSFSYDSSNDTLTITIS